MREYYFNDYKRKLYEYKEFLLSAEEYLEDSLDRLFDFCINLAVSDKWRKWDETMEEGSEFQFTDDMLWQTGDKNINILMKAKADLETALNEILKANPSDDSLNNTKTGTKTGTRKKLEPLEIITEKGTYIRHVVKYLFTEDIKAFKTSKRGYLGPGVEYSHRKVETFSPVTAFIEGFSWLNRPSERTVRVKILSLSIKGYERVIKEIKQAVRTILKDKEILNSPLEYISENVRFRIIE
jgi:hypothetical protein